MPNTKWNPMRVNTHPAHPNVLFVRLVDSIVLISIESQPLFLSQIPAIFGNDKDTMEYITPKTLIVVRRDDEIIQYSLQNYRRLEMLKIFETYDYVFTKFTKQTAARDSGNFYVFATDGRLKE